MTYGEAMSCYEDWHHLQKAGMKDWIKDDEEDVKNSCSPYLEPY